VLSVRALPDLVSPHFRGATWEGRFGGVLSGCLLLPPLAVSNISSSMPSLHATMGLLLLRVMGTEAWTPSAVRLNRLVAARSICRHFPRPPAARSSPKPSSNHSSSRFRTFATATPTTAGEVVDGESGKSEGSGIESVAGEQEEVTPAATLDGDNFQGVVEIQPLLQRHMEVLGSAGRRK